MHYISTVCLVFMLFSMKTLQADGLKIEEQLRLLESRIQVESNSKEKVKLFVLKADILVDSDPEQAENLLLEAQVLARDIDDQRGLLDVNSRLSNIYTHIYGDYFKGMRLAGATLLLSKDLDDKQIRLRSYNNIAFIFSSLKDVKKAIGYAKKSYALAYDMKDSLEIMKVNSFLGELYEQQGQSDSALRYYQMAVDLSNESRLELYPKSYLTLGRYYVLLGEYSKAEKHYRKGIGVFQKLDDNRDLALLYSKLAELYLLQKQPDKAKQKADQAIQLSDSLHYLNEKAVALKVVSDIYQHLENHTAALQYLNDYYTLKDSVYNEKINNQIFLFEDDVKAMLHENELQSLKDQELTQSLQLKNEALKRNILIGGLLFVIVSALGLYSRLRITTTLNNKLINQTNELEQLSIVASDMNNSVAILDNMFQVQWVNKGFNSLTGFDLSEIKGENPLDYKKGPLWSQEKSDYIKQLFLEQKPFSYEYLSYRKNGKPFWVDTNVTPLFNKDGSLEKYITVGTDITEKKKAEIELKQSYESARLLSEIGVGITAAITIDEIVDLVYEKINVLMDSACFGVGLINEDKNELNFVSFIEKGRKYRNVACSLDDRNKMGVLSMVKNREYLIHNLEKEYSNYLDEEPDVVAGELPQSIIYIPLRSKEKSIGVFTVQSFDKYAYQQSHFNLARNIANYVAIAIEKALLYKGMESEVANRTKEIIRQKDELLTTYSNTKLLSEIGLNISSTLNFEEVFQTVHSKISRLMDAEMFGVRIYHEETQEIEYNYEIESGELDPIGVLSMEDKNNYTVWCIENKEDIFIKDNEIEYKNYIDAFNVLTGKAPKSLIFTPMIIENKVIGVITVQSMRINAFERHHLDLLKSLGAYIGSALINGSLYSTLEAKVEARTIDLAQKNKNITDSINYAKRIQNGILPSEKMMKGFLPKSFVYYKPKDIVSGDFYWMAEKNGKVFLAVVDCTGHGVPGAFMSIIGESLLEQAINEPHITRTNQILDFIQEGLQKLFEQEYAGDNYNDLFDGMDMSLCAINMHKRRIEYSGACNSLFMVRNNEVERFRGDKFGISAVDYGIKRSFTSQYVNFEAGDAFYIFSDGLPDQFGGPRTKKFGYKNTSALLSSISDLDVEKQREIVEKRMAEWSEGVEQTDDICFFGFKI